jgi:hypothetical protein
MFRLPPEDETGPRAIYEQLIERAPEFDTLRMFKPDVAFLLRLKPKFRHGKRVLGTCYLPGVQGDLSDLFDWLLEYTMGGSPTFLFVLDDEYWGSAGVRAREILMFHEMSHCGQKRDQYGTPKFQRESGEPVWSIIGHDIEEFNAVVARYGEHDESVRAFIAAARDGEANKGAF